MGFLQKLRAGHRPARGAAFPAAKMGRLTASWTADPGAINRWLRYELRTLRARSRQLARGDAYGARFIRSCVNNIAGPRPFILQSKVRFKDGRPNTTANNRIEQAYAEWSLPGGCELTGRMTMGELDRLLVRCLARDGEILVRILRGGEYGAGKWQLLDIDRLDEQRNENLKSGGAIKMGVEVDEQNTPVAYHILKQHPGEMGEWNRGANPREYEIVPASDIVHVFVADWPEQVRGVPWMHAAMLRLWNLGEFEASAVINARVGASKIAVIESPDGQQPLAVASGKDSAGNLLTDMDAGQYWTLPAGFKLSSFNPQFPDASVDTFMRSCLRGIAAGLGMAYHTLANDPAEVNFSTGRIFRQDEGDNWEALQDFYRDHIVRRRYADWLRMRWLMGELESVYFDDYRHSARFQAKTWSPVQPVDEMQADIAALEAKLTSRGRIAMKRGEDIEEIFDELAEEQAAAAEKGLELEPPKPQPQSPAEPATETDPNSDKPEPQPIKAAHSITHVHLGARNKTVVTPDGRRFRIVEDDDPAEQLERSAQG